MADRNDVTARLRHLVDQRVALETKLQNEPGELSDARSREYDMQYQSLQRQLSSTFKVSTENQDRVTTMLEMMRILENRLVYLQNFIVDPTSENRILAQLVTRFIDDIGHDRSSVLTSLEALYYRAVAALYGGDLAKAREGFSAACASEESDEANDIKYKSYVILGHLSHEEADYAKAKDLHDQSMRYSANDNVTAQALALKALNSYALQDHDDALHLFQEALGLFDENKPFFNSYFFRNALLFCGAIHFDRRDYAQAESFYGRVVSNVDQSSFDFFDALSHLGRIYYAQEKYQDAVSSFERAVQTHRFSENEYVVDTWFWIARCHLRRNESGEARKYLEKIAATDVRYEKKPQAAELLQRIA
ncbi:MAG TPA: tetratricopeptide repeat protein [Thermoanaerobaculia bacterium]|jgi:tetratricopeptide (TPR) repeat protein|nr:tetratricopeptide repeat protein [Thermoanaerobaculia bacterium]